MRRQEDRIVRRVVRPLNLDEHVRPFEVHDWSNAVRPRRSTVGSITRQVVRNLDIRTLGCGLLDPFEDIGSNIVVVMRIVRMRVRRNLTKT